MTPISREERDHEEQAEKGEEQVPAPVPTIPENSEEDQ